MDTLLGLLAVCALVFMNGFFVAAEFSFVGARRTRIEQLAQEGNAGAKAARQAMEHLDHYIAATQLGITLARAQPRPKMAAPTKSRLIRG